MVFFNFRLRYLEHFNKNNYTSFYFYYNMVIYTMTTHMNAHSKLDKTQAPVEESSSMSGGKHHHVLIGSRAQVWHGTAHKTSGGLTKKDLLMNKNGRIVSKAKHNTAKKEKRLERAGYFAQKGKFGAIKKSATRTKKNKSSKRR